MKRLNQILIAALALQIVAAGGLYIGQQPGGDARAQTALLETAADRVTRITIVDEDGHEADLSKTGGHWVLPGYHQLPASDDKVQQVLDELATRNSGWPVATTASGRERFKVGDTDFHKKIVLADASETLQTLYLGTSPGYRQVHVRRDGENEIYAVKLDGYALSAENDQWLEQNLLQPRGEIVALKGAGFSLSRKDGAWRAAGGEAVTGEVEKLAKSLAQIHVFAAADKSPTAVDYELTVETADGHHGYRFFKDGDDYYVGRDDFESAFKIGKRVYEDVVGKSASQLVRAGKTQDAEPGPGKDDSAKPGGSDATVSPEAHESS